MTSIIQNIKNEIVLAVDMYQYNVRNDKTEYIEMWVHHIDQIRTTIYSLWSMHIITTHAYDTLIDFLWDAVKDTDLEPKTL